MRWYEITTTGNPRLHGVSSLMWTTNSPKVAFRTSPLITTLEDLLTLTQMTHHPEVSETLLPEGWCRCGVSYHAHVDYPKVYLMCTTRFMV